MSPRPMGRRKGTTAERCRCGAVVLAGVSWSGITVRVDRTPLSPTGELDAVMAGLWTYTWHPVADELHARDVRAITERPAGTRARQTVHPIHRCGDAWQALPVSAQPAAASTDPAAPPPY